MPMEFVFIIGMAVLLILCVKVKANAFISLLATALVMGLLSGMSGADTVAAITGGFSGTVKNLCEIRTVYLNTATKKPLFH